MKSIDIFCKPQIDRNSLEIWTYEVKSSITCWKHFSASCGCYTHICDETESWWCLICLLFLLGNVGKWDYSKPLYRFLRRLKHMCIYIYTYIYIHNSTIIYLCNHMDCWEIRKCLPWIMWIHQGLWGIYPPNILLSPKKRTGPSIAHQGPCSFLLKFKGEGMAHGHSHF